MRCLFLTLFFMVDFTLHLILWIICILFRFFVIYWVCYGIYFLIKDKREWWLVGKHEKEKEDKEREKKWERVSKELKESWFSLDAREKEMTPEEKAEYDKRMTKIKKDKKVVIIALIILWLLMLRWIIVSIID